MSDIDRYNFDFWLFDERLKTKDRENLTTEFTSLPCPTSFLSSFLPFLYNYYFDTSKLPLLFLCYVLFYMTPPLDPHTNTSIATFTFNYFFDDFTGGAAINGNSSTFASFVPNLNKAISSSGGNIFKTPILE